MNWSSVLLAIFFVGAGLGHFAAPAAYIAIMPLYLPWPSQLIAISGAAEILGGLGICFRGTRSFAGWGLIVLLVAVFPANIQAISTGMVVGGHAVPAWMLWARLPFQLLFMVLVYSVCLNNRR